MKVSLNGREVEVFSGARVRDALQLHAAHELPAVETGEKHVYDRWGNQVDLEGELVGGERLEVR
jgi:hypothetical protein